MKLSELQPSFLVFTQKPGVLRCHDDYTNAQGIWFLCPLCKDFKHGRSSPHSFTLLFPSAPEKAQPHGRWNHSGSSYEDLSLLETVIGPCGFKGHVRNGQIETLSA